MAAAGLAGRGPHRPGAFVTGAPPEVTVAVLAHGPEPFLHDCVAAVLASTGVVVTVRLVDNGCTSDAVDRLAVEGREQVRVLRPAKNTGFSGGCNLALQGAATPFVALVNSDAVVAPGALARLVEVAGDSSVGIASGSIRLASDPDVINSAGNPVTWYGASWAGGLGEPAARHDHLTEVAGASGAGLALRTQVWEQLRGFDAAFFAYHEDTDLSLRCWQRGLRVVHVPDAVVLHHYEFSRNPLKLYLVERNRLLVLLTVLSRRTLLLTGPGLLAVEAGTLLTAIAQGWTREKVRGWLWLMRHARHVRDRRAAVQADRLVPDSELARHLSSRFTPAGVAPPPGTGAANAVLAAWWSIVRPLL